MAVFKCKMCGGDLDVVDGMSVQNVNIEAQSKLYLN